MTAIEIEKDADRLKEQRTNQTKKQAHNQMAGNNGRNNKKKKENL